MLNTFGDTLADNVEALAAWVSTLGKRNAIDFVDLETADDKYTYVAKDGSMMTMLRVDGISQLPGKEEAVMVFDRMAQSLNAYLSKKGHVVQMVFERNPERVQEDIAAIQQPAVNTAQRIGLDVQDLLSERESFLTKFTCREVTYMCLWTTIATLNKIELEQGRREQFKFFKTKRVPSITNAQYVAAVVPAIRDRHHSFVRSIMGDLQTSMLTVTPIEVHEAGRIMRGTLDPEFTAPDWKPLLPGDKFFHRRTAGLPAGDLSDIMWPPLRNQLVARDVQEYGIRYAAVGNIMYQPMYIDVFPQDGQSFMGLFRRIPKDLPWRVSFLLAPDGLDAISNKTVLTSFLAFASLDNKLINEAKDELLARYEEGEKNVQLRICFTTWAPIQDIDLLNQRSSALARAVQGWGDCTPREATGDPTAGLFSTLPGVTYSSIGNVAAAPITEAVGMMPLLRPMLPWQSGAITFRSVDGRLLPYQPGSSLQTTWIDLYFARPGAGKSVTMNAVNLAMCLAPGISRLPRIAITDVGPSSSGLISLIKEGLPEEQKHYAGYFKLRMTDEYSVNPFDTQLGCRFPTPLERAFMVNFLTLLATPISMDRAYDGVAEMCGMLIDEVYKFLSDSHQARVYSPGICKVVDDQLPNTKVIFDRRTTWWEVVDALFDAGYIHEASLAQRYASPLLADIVGICSEQQVRDLYGKKSVDDEPLIDAVRRMLSSAAREYPILSRPTVFDIGDARIVSLDLNDVVKTGGQNADRQTAVMYMLARHITASKFFLLPEDVRDMPERYRVHHKKIIDEIREDVKRICMDEFHKTKSAKVVREQIISDMREGRKWGIHIGLASQSLEDFDATMIELSTNIFIMGSGHQSTNDNVADAFGLNSSARTALARAVHGPREDGVAFIAKFDTTKGVNTQLLVLTLGPIELWALETSVETTILRKRLYDAIGPKSARRVLARRYPSPSLAKKEIERLRTALKDSGDMTEEAELGVIDQVYQDLVDEFKRNTTLYV